MFDKFFVLNVDASLEDSKIIYKINIKPNEKNYRFNDVKVILSLNSTILVNKGGKEFSYPSKFITEEIDIKNDGTYSGIVIDENTKGKLEYLKAPTNIKVIAKKLSGTYVK